MNGITSRRIKFAILELLHSDHRKNKFNLLGRPNLPGALERHLTTQFDTSQRAIADLAFEELKRDDLIRATYRDLINPGDWVVLTDAGSAALERQALDELDYALLQISPHLLEIREGAWAAVHSRNPDAMRQASHSARELIEQTLKEGTSDDEIRQDENFIPDKKSETRITRRHRLKFLMNKHKGEISESAIRVTERGHDFILALDSKFQAASHHRGESPSAQELADSLRSAEMLLRQILI